MRRLLSFVLGALLLAPPAQAAIAVVQVQSGALNDVVLTFASPWGASNHVLVAAVLNSGTATAALDDISVAEGVLLDSGSGVSANNMRIYIWCFAGDGADSAVTVTTSGTTVATAAGVEISGGSCTQDGAGSSNDETGNGVDTHVLTTDITTTASGSFIFAIIRSTTASNWSAGTDMTSIPADGTDIGQGLAEYRILGAAAAYDTPFSNDAAETSHMGAAAVQPAAVAASRPCCLGVF
jgi:hypothetical protein